MAQQSEKRSLAEQDLPTELKETFDALIEDYLVAAQAHTGRKWVNYNILADLVRAGWRKVS